MELKVEYTSWTLLNDLWSGGKENARRLCEIGAWDRCYEIIESMADDGELSLTDVNDMLWFEFGYFLECLGYKEEDDGSLVLEEDEDIE